MRRIRQHAQLLCELAGYAAITAAAFCVAVPLGLLAAGAALVWIGNAKAGD